MNATKNVLLWTITVIAAPVLIASCTSTVDPLDGTTELRSTTELGSTTEPFASMRISELSDAQAEAWCEWFSNKWCPTGHVTPPEDGPIQPDGTVNDDSPTQGGDGYASDYFRGLCMMHLPIDQCVMNLRLHPCDASVQLLDDCVDTVLGAVTYETSYAPCKQLNATPSCSETIVAAYPPLTSDQLPTCVLPVQ
jgi:hypothetical protein